jgi:hypothetical protein
MHLATAALDAEALGVFAGEFLSIVRLCVTGK